MTVKFLPLLLLIPISILSSCGNKAKSSSSAGADTDIEAAIATAEGRRAADPDASAGNTCLLGYQTKYDQLLTEEMVMEATGFAKEKLHKVDYSKVLKNVEYHSIEYKFKNKRVGKLLGAPANFGELEIYDGVELSTIKSISLNQFNNSYRAKTAEENAQVKQIIGEAMEGNSESKEANEQAKKIEKTGVSKNTTKAVANTITDAFANVSKAFEAVESLGDAATWNSFSQELDVLSNGVQFRLEVDVANDKEKNKQVAIALAQKILEKCK